MNANELADWIEKSPYSEYHTAIEAAFMLRQQQAEIEALKNRELTDEEIKQVWNDNLAVMGNDLQFARAILRKAQEK